MQFTRITISDRAHGLGLAQTARWAADTSPCRSGSQAGCPRVKEHCSERGGEGRPRQDSSFARRSQFSLLGLCLPTWTEAECQAAVPLGGSVLRWPGRCPEGRAACPRPGGPSRLSLQGLNLSPSLASEGQVSQSSLAVCGLVLRKQSIFRHIPCFQSCLILVLCQHDVKDSLIVESLMVPSL